eukprot:scaffold38006_cov18-Tisochrysis_lutea.AAC.1
MKPAFNAFDLQPIAGLALMYFTAPIFLTAWPYPKGHEFNQGCALSCAIAVRAHPEDHEVKVAGPAALFFPGLVQHREMVGRPRMDWGLQWRAAKCGADSHLESTEAMDWGMQSKGSGGGAVGITETFS